MGANQKKFVGWNGGAGESKSSDEILEEALLVPDSWRFNKTRLISSATYSENNFDFTKANVTSSTGAPKRSAVTADMNQKPGRIRLSSEVG